MPIHQEFSVELDGSPIVGRLSSPEAAPAKRPPPVVMLCSPVPTLNDYAEALRRDVTDALLGAGFAVAVLLEGSAGRRGSRLAVESLDDAAAVLHGLVIREDLDVDRLGVLGHSIGGIVAACLSSRSDRIAGVCLLSPPGTDQVIARANGSELTAHIGSTDVPPGFFDGVDTLSPPADLARYDRPTLVLHGAADRIVEPDRSLAYRDAVREAGHQIDYALVARGDHFYTNAAARSACMDMITRFFGGLAARPAS